MDLPTMRRSRSRRVVVAVTRRLDEMRAGTWQQPAREPQGSHSRAQRAVWPAVSTADRTNRNTGCSLNCCCRRCAICATRRDSVAAAAARRAARAWIAGADARVTFADCCAALDLDADACRGFAPKVPPAPKSGRLHLKSSGGR